MSNKKSRLIYVLVMLSLSILVFVHGDVWQKMLYEFSGSYNNLPFFLFSIIFSFAIDNIMITYKSFKLVSTLIPAIVITLWYGPYTAALMLSTISFFRVNTSRAENITHVILRSLSRASIYFLMFSLPGEIMNLNIPFYSRLLVYLVLVLIINQIIMRFYYPFFSSQRWMGIKKSVVAYFMELLPGLILVPVSQAIYNLQLLGYENLFNLYYIFPIFSIILVLLTIVLRKTEREQKERIRLNHFKQAIKGILSGLNLVRSTEDFNVILQKSTKLLADMLGYKTALVSLIDRKNGTINRIGYYGMERAAFEKIKTRKFTKETLNNLFNLEYEFGGTFFLPAESASFKKMFPGESVYDKDQKFDDDKWHPDDLFLIPFLNSQNEFSGYISLDCPINGKRPAEEDAEIARIFAEQIGRMVETSFKYNQVLETSKKDQMTKLYNHTTFYEKTDEMIQASSFDKPLSLLMMDIDDFKAFNDQYGHVAGDNALKKVASIIKNTIPSKAIGARYGGEEFAVLLPQTDKLKAVEIANDLLHKIAQTDIEGVRVTLSCGVSTCPEDGRHSSTLVSSADNALYISKKTGKNKVTMV